MIRPLDMQVAFNAMPEVARQAGGEQAGLVYRQVQDLGRAREENLVRHERVNHTETAGETVFRPVHSRFEEGSSGHGANKRDPEERRRSYEREREALPYAPSGRRVFSRALDEEAAGLSLDLSA